MFQQDIYTSVKLTTAINVCPAGDFDDHLQFFHKE